MDTDRKHFLFNLEWAEILSELPKEVKYEVYDAIVEYARSGKLLDLKPIAKGAFLFIKREMDYNNQQYQSKSRQYSENGRKGGNPNFQKGKPNPYRSKKQAGITENNQSIIPITENNQSIIPITENNQSIIPITENKPIYDNEYDIDNAVVAPLPPRGEAAAETAAAKLKRDVEFQKTQVIWKTGICMKFHIDELRVNDYLDEFYTDMLCRGYHVTNVPSLFTSWLSDRLNQSKKQARNETAKTLKDDRLSERRGTEPSSEDRKGFKGTFQRRD